MSALKLLIKLKNINKEDLMKFKSTLLGVSCLFFISCSLIKKVDKQTQPDKVLIRSSSSANKLRSRPSNQSIINKKEIEITNSDNTLSCHYSYTDEFSPSYIFMSTICKTDVTNETGEIECWGISQLFESFCKEDKKTVIHYYCDSKKKGLYAMKKIQCEKSCVSGACAR